MNKISGDHGLHELMQMSEPDDEDDRHIDELAIERVATFDPATAISMDEMLRRFGVEEEQNDGVVLPALLEPNAVTIEAMEEARRGGLKSFASIDDLMADLHADD